LEASEEVLGRRKKSRKDWISDNTWGKTAKRKEIKSKELNTDNAAEKVNLRRQYWEANKSVKKAARRDKRTWAENLAQSAQNAADSKNSRDLYRITRQLAKKSFTNAGTLVRGKDGKQLAVVEEQVQRWQEHFGKILSAPPQEHEHDTNTTEHLLALNDKPPKYTEIVKAIKQLKKKAAGPDGIPSEIVKACPNMMATLLEPLIRTSWEHEHFPDEWKTGYIIKLPKKSDLSDCKNWRGITLLNTINKLVATIIHQRLTEKLELLPRKEQAGFRPHRACVDQINTLRIVVEQSLEYRSSRISLTTLYDIR
jgi:hypothetical protein